MLGQNSHLLEGSDVSITYLTSFICYPFPTKLSYFNFHPPKLCHGTATHKVKWLEITCICLTLSILTLHCHLHPLQAANCCRNSRLVVHEDDLMYFKN